MSRQRSAANTDRAGRRGARVRRHVTAAAALTALLALAAACTSSHPPKAAHSSAPGASVSAPGSTLGSAPVSPAVSSPPVSSSAAPDGGGLASPAPPGTGVTRITGTVVIGGATPARTSISLSRALFTSAPMVVVASPVVAADVASGAEEAEQIGVPLLLLDLDDKTPTGAMPTAALFAQELQRLGTTSVVAIGASAADVAVAAPGVNVVPAPTGETYAVSSADLTVLVSAGVNAASDAIAADATASATVAGANVVAVHGTDPRRDPGPPRSCPRLRRTTCSRLARSSARPRPSRRA